MAVVITVLVIACLALIIVCSGLAWHIREQRQDIDFLSRTLVKALEEHDRAGGDADRLPPPGPGPW